MIYLTTHNMTITISANLTEEQAIIIAKEKGYQPVFTIIEWNTVVWETENEETPFEFLKRVYENIIKEDAKKIFIAYDDRLNIEAKLAREQSIADMVDAAFL